MKLEDKNQISQIGLDNEVERMFNAHYVANLTGSPPFIRVESEGFVN
jgi:hypothetical protein